MTLEHELEDRRKQLAQACEERERLELRIAELEAGIAFMEQRLGRTASVQMEKQQVVKPFSIANLGVSEAALMVLRGHGAVMTIDEVYEALRAAGRPEDREAVSNALAYLARSNQADRAGRGRYIRR